jgi:hypothetical protein
MKVFTGVLALLAVAGVGVRALADATQSRPDRPERESRSELVLEVDTSGGFDRQLAAQGLWGACQSNIEGTATESFEARSDGEFAIVVWPALGHTAEKRITGCLEDFTIDRVLGNVTSVRHLAPAGTG